MGSVMIVQSLRAMADAHPEKFTYSFHVQFIGRGTNDKTIDYEMTTTSDSRSTTTAIIRVSQEGTPLAVMMLSAALPARVEKERWSDVNDVRGHERIEDEKSEVGWFLEPAGFKTARAKNDIRYFPYWFRYRREPNDQHEQIIVAAYVSDQGISNTGFPPHVTAEDSMFNLTLNHSLWLHQPFDVFDWVMVQSKTTATANGRGTAHGYMITEDGRRIATFSQEVLLLSRKSEIMRDRVQDPT